MRLLSAILLLAAAVAVFSKTTAPRVLSIQVNRCPTPDSYSNIHEEEETVSNYFVSESKKVIQSEFVETIRFMANESGTVQFFVVGQGNFSVDIEADNTVIEGINGVHHVDGQDGGAVITLPFKILQGVRETTINMTFNTRTIKKVTLIYASTKSLEPPRPPSLYTSLIFSPEDIQTIENLPKNGTGSGSNTESEEEFPGTSGKPSRPLRNGTADATVIDSPYNLQYNPFSSEKNIEGSSSSLRFDNLAMNRLSSNQMEEYGKKHFYNLSIKKSEHGQMVFDVSGDGKKWVAVKSHKENIKVWKVMEVIDGRAVLPYRDGAEYVDEDRIVAVLINGFEKRTHIYVHVTRVD
ncbi:hypothetical protein CAEBREN_01606 [Caenorhabditis brenneri]|uniref:Uncharacterized protein n=1 Tax=Caenorhabditis brenneri TaxID=135651 RepID=G0MGU0_CAEBE|nr:hypothetical protein CAEBREN_01606 [Caenorhabditis brenneri]